MLTGLADAVVVPRKPVSLARHRRPTRCQDPSLREPVTDKRDRLLPVHPVTAVTPWKVASVAIPQGQFRTVHSAPGRSARSPVIAPRIEAVSGCVLLDQTLWPHPLSVSSSRNRSFMASDRLSTDFRV